MSIYATNYIVDELTGEAKLVKRLNKTRIDRFTIGRVGGWNKSGKKVRVKKRWKSPKNRKKIILNSQNDLVYLPS